MLLIGAPVVVHATINNPPNIIVILADDLGWNDLPYFSNPEDRSAYPVDFPEKDIYVKGHRGEPARIRAARNRFAARAFADRVTGAFGSYLREKEDSDDSVDQFAVSPIDQDASTGSYTPNSANCIANARAKHLGLCEHEGCSGCDGSQSEPSCCNQCCEGADCCQAHSDVLRGFGGLARLGAEGTTFPRFYANSSKCAPLRAAYFSGRYPRRVGVTLNGGQLSGDEVTIAEFLKQGCNDTSDLERQVFDGEKFFPSPCYIDDISDPATSECSDNPCYRTGLLGKWHMGNGTKAPWAQGFDEYFGFGGGSRHYWSTKPLNCSLGMPMCDFLDPSLSKTDTVCDEAGTPCLDAQGNQVGTCTKRGLYHGLKQSFNACSSAHDPKDVEDCCVPGSSHASYQVTDHLGENVIHSETNQVVKTKGKDQRRKTAFPCNDDGLTKDTECAYSTRVYRDQARNFIVRNSDRQPYFMTVSLHAPHFGFSAPLRTVNHYTTSQEGSTSRLRAQRPNKATDYWAIIEEMDAAVGEILKVLDQKGVCENDPRVGCTSDSECAAGSTCIAVGRCSSETSSSLKECRSDSECTAVSGEFCDFPSQHTLVMFFSDHGRPNSGSDYGKPHLRGGKGNTFEGALRVGMLARVPRVCVNDTTGVPTTKRCANDEHCDAGTSCPKGATKGVGSIVDVYATAADVAGYTPNTSDSKHFEINRHFLCTGTQTPCNSAADCTGSQTCDAKRVCTGTQTACTTNQDCAPKTCDGPVVVDGVSLMSILEAPAIDHSQSDPVWPRNFVYGSYPGDGIVTTSAAGHFAKYESHEDFAIGTCFYDSRKDNATAPRRIQAGSCAVCDPAEDEAAECGQKWCKFQDGICMDPADATDASFECASPQNGICINTDDPLVTIPDLRNLPTGEPEDGLYRCRTSSDCPTGFGAETLKCYKNVWIKCNKCVESAWKLMSTAKVGASQPSALFDLRSNPVEDSRLNFLYKDCDKSNGEIDSESGPGLLNVRNQLLNGNVGVGSAETAADLQGWLDCADSDCTDELY